MRPKMITCVYPEFPETYWSFNNSLALVDRKGVMPPLGLATIAAMIPDRYECRIIDMNVEPLEDDAILESDLVLLSAMIVQRDSFEEVVARCNRLGVPVAAGGPFPTSLWSEIEGVDHFVLNEGEVTFPRFLADWEAGRPQPFYGDESRPDLSLAPVPRFELLRMNEYTTLPLQYSRGCPFDCEFCDIVQLFGRNPRTKSPEQFLREMDAAYATGFRGPLFIVDDNFIGNKREVKKLLRAIIPWQEERRFPFTLSTEASVNLAEDEELLDLMVRSGFSMVFVGIETPVEESLAGTNKQQNLRMDLLESVKTIQRKGIEVTGGFIVGFDTDPPEIFRLQEEFIRQLAIPTSMVGLLMALPGTKLYHRLDAEGRLVKRASGNNTHDLVMNFRPVLPPEFLTEGYLRLLSSIYEPETYFRRCLDLLRRFPARGERTRNKGAEPVSPGRIGYLLGIFRRIAGTPDAGATFRYLLKAFLLRPRYVVQIVTFAVQGHHFFTITRKLAEAARTGAAGSASGKKVVQAA